MYITKRRDPMYDFFNEMFRSPFISGSNDTSGSKLMQTDIRETEDGYTLDIDLPGFAKENIQAELKDGYLTITATKTEEDEKKEAEGKFLRRERFKGTCKRSFYVGEYLHEGDINAQFTDGVLKLSFPKEKEPEPEQPKLISIL